MFRGRQHSGSTGTPRKGKWRRRLLRAVLGLVALLFLGCAFLFYGWRYGFRPLPEPLTGPEAARPVLPTLAEVGPDNYWYWPQALQKHIPTNAFEAEILIQTVQEWCRYGWVDQTNRVLLREWIKRTPELDTSYRGALRATNSVMRISWISDDWPRWHYKVLRAYAAWLALEAEQDGRIPEALDRLVESWRLEAFSTSFPVIHWSHAPQRIDQVWRRLLLSTPTLPLDRVQAWQEGLDAVRRSLPPFAETYEGVVAERLSRGWVEASDFPSSMAPTTREDLGPVLRDLLLGMLETGAETAATTLRRFMGLPVESRSDRAGFQRLCEFARASAYVLAWRCARPEDQQQVLEAFHTRTLRALRQTNLMECYQSPEAVDVRWWDRPTAWSMWHQPTSGFKLVSERVQWLVPLTSCQVTLALRIFKDQSGSWPTKLAEVAPGLAQGLTLDPLNGEPLDYQTDGSDWQVSASKQTTQFQWFGVDKTLAAFHSREDEVGYFRFTCGLLSNGLHRNNAWLLPALQRYGIVQPTAPISEMAPVLTNLLHHIQEHRALGLSPSVGPGWGLPTTKQTTAILPTLKSSPAMLTNLALPVSSRFPSHEYDDRGLLRRKASPPPPPL